MSKNIPRLGLGILRVDEVEGPIGWLVVKGKKGHLSQERHIELLAMVQELVGEAGQVMVLDDGVFDGNPPFALTLSPNALFKKTVRWQINTMVLLLFI